METIFERIAYCVEVGKINAATPYPPTMKGEDGADELTAPLWQKDIHRMRC